MMNNSDTIHFETRVPVREVMRSHPTTIDVGETVARAAQSMCRDEVGSCIVLQNNLPIGIVTEEDINCKVVAKDLKPSEVYVSEIMSTPLITIGAEKLVGDAAAMMVKNRVRRLPVVENQMVIGIVTVRDILTVAAEVNELLADLIEINREEEYAMGVCDRCGKMSDDLSRVDSLMLCPTCREEEQLL
ncbi:MULTISPECIES: cyclic nucleotide-binding/CBS domain-containing protein [Methanoculleus]|mgnify:FL=1|jgi:signal-transduction protein with cAMP-binding, CBS, and nucleotidyltransferase domain|uniref:CBS domain-containing protein n=1 Tax=Methanoculleus thermophilus TaxID=2200 RepID=A0A1G9C3F1_9EURY|nr:MULTISPECIES: CBS domain-containing protein [Methanoculleus]NLN09862.1 CBS domain-containing protein [Methanoculleus thermophilus]SDK46210.1 CBS domain-containing protein [Methanoculleus thermophilus]